MCSFKKLHVERVKGVVVKEYNGKTCGDLVGPGLNQSINFVSLQNQAMGHWGESNAPRTKKANMPSILSWKSLLSFLGSSKKKKEDDTPSKNTAAPALPKETDKPKSTAIEESSVTIDMVTMQDDASAKPDAVSEEPMKMKPATVPGK